MPFITALKFFATGPIQIMVLLAKDCLHPLRIGSILSTRFQLCHSRSSSLQWSKPEVYFAGRYTDHHLPTSLILKGDKSIIIKDKQGRIVLEDHEAPSHHRTLRKWHYPTLLQRKIQHGEHPYGSWQTRPPRFWCNHSYTSGAPDQ